jgi:hypothetical protein
VEEIAMSSSKPTLPPRWDEERIREVIAHYENQTEDEQFAEIESAWRDPGVTWVVVPTRLVPDVVALIDRHRKIAETLDPTL